MFFKISAAFFLVNLVSSLDHEALRGASRDLAECTGCWPGTSGNCKNPANNVCYLIAGDPLVCPAGTLPCGDPDPDDPDVVECTDCWGDTSGNCKHIVDSSCYYSPTGICTPGTLPCGDQDPEPVCINDIDRNRPLRPDAGCDSLLPVCYIDDGTTGSNIPANMGGTSCVRCTNLGVDVVDNGCNSNKPNCIWKDPDTLIVTTPGYWQAGNNCVA